MPIEFKLPESIEKQLRPVQMIAENVMRPESRELDDSEHVRPARFISALWPSMQAMERANLDAALSRAQAKQSAVQRARPTATTDMAALQWPNHL